MVQMGILGSTKFQERSKYPTMAVTRFNKVSSIFDNGALTESPCIFIRIDFKMGPKWY